VTPASRRQAVQGLSPTRTTLGNGLVTIVKETRKTPIVSISLAVRAGSICDPLDMPGAASLLGRVIDRGTVTRSADEIAEAIDSRGISLSIHVTRHLLSILCTCLAEDFVPIISLLGDAVMNASVPDAELATRKGEAITAIRQDDDNPFVCAAEGLFQELYGTAHPYGRRVKGTVDAVEAMSRDTLVRLHRERFAPSAVTVVVVGDVDTGRVQDTAATVFGSWRAVPPPPIALPHAIPASARRQVVLRMMNKSQADIAYGFTSITRSDPQYYAYYLMNHVLGQYAIGGRLGDSIRERQGMAYYAGSVLEANVIEGPLFVRAGVSPANVDRAIASIDAELTRLRADGLTQAELDDSRNYLVGSMPRSLETNAGIASFLQSNEFFELGLDYDVRLAELLGRVTLDDANAAALRAVDPARATIVIAGPYEGPGIG
jgi:zinc protease